jgi:iron(III) transport system permease protein
LGRWVYPAWGFLVLYFFLSKVLPILVLLWASVLPFFQLPSARAFAAISVQHYELLPWPLVWSALGNTSLLMVLTPTIVLFLSLAFSWVTLRTRVRGRGLVDFVAFLPHAVPNVVFGIGALLFVLFILQPILPLYGTVWVLLAIFVIARVSYGTRMTNSALIQIHRELEESARISGANTDGVLLRVVIPLIRPTFLYAWLWIALLTYRELTLAVVLTVRDNITAPVLIWNMWLGGGLGPSAALATVLMFLVLPLIVLYWVVARSRRMALL